MFIQTESTPNPNSIKFIPGVKVCKQSQEYDDSNTNINSPLASQLLQLDGIIRVFLSEEFITVTKNSELDWNIIKPAVFNTIMDFFLNYDVNELEDQNDDTDLSQIDQQIKQIIDEQVRPMVEQDGGNIIFDHFKDGIVYLKMQGACNQCPHSAFTLKNGVENLLKHSIKEVVAVEQVG